MSKKAKHSMCFEGMTFCLTGAMSMGTRKHVWMVIQSHGGNVAATVTGGTTHLIASDAEYVGETNKVVTAKSKGTMIVTEEFLSACMDAGKKVDEGPYLLSKGSDGGASLGKKKKDGAKTKKFNLNGGVEPDELENSDNEGGWTGKSKDGKLQYVKKGKSAVDPTCKFLVKDGHVLEEGDDVYSCMLNMTDISFGVKGSNKYYVLQVIEHDKKPEWWVWNRWGRVGVVGQRKAQQHATKELAKEAFFKKFREKTGNAWEDRHTAKNKVGKYNVVEIDYGSDDDEDGNEKETAGSDEEKFEYKHKKPKKPKSPSPYNTSDDDISTEEDIPENKKGNGKDKAPLKISNDGADSKNKGKNIIVAKEEEEEGGSSSSTNKNKSVDNKPKPVDNKNNKKGGGGGGGAGGDQKDSELNPRLQEFIKLICDVKMMKQELLNMDIDLKRMPLGKLNKKQIKKGYSVLKEINDLIKNSASKDQLIHQSNLFYTLIPHNFGFHKPPIIADKASLQAKMNLLETMTDIQIATTLMQDIGDSDQNPIDSRYRSLKADMEPLDQESEEYKTIEEYVKNTHAPTHTEYKLDVEDIFTVNREVEEDAFAPNKKAKNRMLLWHGSRLTNFVGILSQGLRIAPPEAPTTGYMFGKGVYFADMVTKSANYCHTSAKNSTGCLILSEVALGDPYEMYKAQYFDKPPSGFHSVKGIGKWIPDPAANKTLNDGVIVPVGEPADNPDTTPTVLNYNEYIVYDTSQVRIRYILRLKFNYAGTPSSSSSKTPAPKKTSTASTTSTTTTTTSSPPSSPSSSSSSTSKKGAWQYKAGTGWKNYRINSAADSAEIQDNKDKGTNTFQIDINGTSYTIDFDDEQQYQTSDPSKARQIRFLKKK